MTPESLTWPARCPSCGSVRLRAYRADDVAMVRDLATDPYVPLIGTLPADADAARALDYIERQQTRLVEGTGFSFVIADAVSDTALLRSYMERGGRPRDMALYACVRGS